MSKYAKEEEALINSLNKPINNVDMNLVNSLVNKMIMNKYYEDVLAFLNNLFDFAKIPDGLVDKLINDDNKECVAEFLENEDSLFFLKEDEIKKLKSFLNVPEINIKLKESYDYYYDLLFKQGVRPWKEKQIDDNTIEHSFIRYNKLIKLKLKEIKDIGLVASSVDYKNYNLPREEQVLKEIDYINEYGFNIDRNLDSEDIIGN